MSKQNRRKNEQPIGDQPQQDENLNQHADGMANDALSQGDGAGEVAEGEVEETAGAAEESTGEVIGDAPAGDETAE